MHRFAGHPRQEVHVGEAADAAHDLLGDGQFGAVADEVLADPLGLGRPDVFLQPGHQWQVVGQAAEQAHGGMAVGVDQARGEQHARQLAGFRRRVAQRFGARGEEGDTAVADAQRVVTEDDASGFHRDNPGRQQKQVERGFGFGHLAHPGRVN
ncbi:hypothetical protein D3C81_1456960 [compost metagenome]